MTGFDLKQFDEEIPQGRLFVDIGFGPDAEIPDDMTLLVQDDNAFFVIPAHEDAQSGDAVDIEECGRHGRRPPKGLKYKIKIDREKYVVEGAQITGAQIIAFSWIDIREVRESDASAYVMLNDSEQSIPGGVVDTMRSYGLNAVPWSHRDEVRERLAA